MYIILLLAKLVLLASAVALLWFVVAAAFKGNRSVWEPTLGLSSFMTLLLATVNLMNADVVVPELAALFAGSLIFTAAYAGLCFGTYLHSRRRQSEATPNQ